MSLPRPKINIPEDEIEERFVRASGPGGQHVNKVATAVQLRFDIVNSLSLSEAVKKQLVRLAGKKVTQDGVLVIEARSERSQERNRQAARGRLNQLIRKAAKRPKIRKPTRPGRKARQQRLNAKKQRARHKALRRRVFPGDDY